MPRRGNAMAHKRVHYLQDDDDDDTFEDPEPSRRVIIYSENIKINDDRKVPRRNVAGVVKEIRE